MAAFTDKEELTWAMFCHLAALAMFVGIPFGNIIGPLVVWLVKKDQYAFVNDQGKEALNFQISVTIYGIIAAVLCLVLIGFLLLPILLLFQLIYTIIGGIKANQGEYFRYPFTIRFLN
ncbi:MAG: DUF4870 domain-containing protein [Candidatus Hydrogenedentes bacterium]|nr:DUF4870 domain-containing protein [Candidatus Hydrogenedentota bacterium]